MVGLRWQSRQRVPSTERGARNANSASPDRTTSSDGRAGADPNAETGDRVTTSRFRPPLDRLWQFLVVADDHYHGRRVDHGPVHHSSEDDLDDLGVVHTTSTASGPKTDSCATRDLKISIGSPNGTAGAVHYVLTYLNAGTSPCTLFGYPGLSFLATDGSQIGSPAQRTTGVGVTSVTLAPGAAAYSGVSVTDPGIPPCSSSGTATRVRVFPPGETHEALAVPAGGIAVCSSGNTPSYRSAIIGPLVSSSP